MKILFLSTLVLLNINLIKTACVSAPVVQTIYGKIEGTSDTKTYKYLGIPYALPPVNELRWKRPVDARSWSPNILQAKNFQPGCPGDNMCALKYQCETTQSEDCLYLNVFVPKTIQNNEKKAVMVYIYGGNFDSGSSSYYLYDPSNIVSNGDVIVVTINYRIGALGFLMSGTETGQIEGNFGLMDQQLAIKWVYDNIDYFGGDNQRITLFGQSAGGQSVSFHLLSSNMQSYFNNAIIQSMPIGVAYRSYQEAFALYSYFSQHINCSIKDIDCLRSKSVNEIYNAQLKANSETTSAKFGHKIEPWIPWTDGTFVKYQQLDFQNWLNGENFKIKPFIIGSLTDEGLQSVYYLFQSPLNYQYYYGLISQVFGNNAAQVFSKYPFNTQLDDHRPILAKLATDWIFGCSARNFLEKSVSQSYNNFYYYIFNFVVEFDAWNFPLCNQYVCHGGDIPFTFNNPNELFTSRGKLLSLQMIRYWSNFAKNSNPNSNDAINFNNNLEYNINWFEYDLNNKKSIQFNNNTNIIIDHYNDDYCNLFDSIGFYY